MIKEVFGKMPDNVKSVIEKLRKEYKNETLKKGEVRHEADGYTRGLRDANFITETERQALFIYIVA